jgi:glycine dehydrogenase subunit 2
MRGMEKTIFKNSREGKRGIRFSGSGVQDKALKEYLPADCLRQDTLKLPELTELDVVRYFTNLSRQTSL